jgi:hypothetical protein
VCTKVICTRSGLSHISNCKIRHSSYAISTKFNSDCARSIHVCGWEGCNAPGTWDSIRSREKDRPMIQETLVPSASCLCTLSTSFCNTRLLKLVDMNKRHNNIFLLLYRIGSNSECGPAGVAENIWITVMKTTRPRRLSPLIASKRCGIQGSKMNYRIQSHFFIIQQRLCTIKICQTDLRP